MFAGETFMKLFMLVLVTCLVTAIAFYANETSGADATIESAANIPEGYEVGEKSLSPNGRFAILYPIHSDENAELPPNLLVCLKPYSVLTRILTEGGRLAGHTRRTAGEVERQLNGRDLVRGTMGDEGPGDL